MALTEKAIEASVKAALEARRERDKRRKIQDEALISLQILVVCTVEKRTFFPPLNILVDGIRKPEGINTRPGEESNEKSLWLVVGVDSAGVRPIKVQLEPVAGSEEYFRSGHSGSVRLEPALLRNELEKAGREFSVPQLLGPECQPHQLPIKILPKRTKWLRTVRADEIPEQWCDPADIAEEK